MRTYIILMYTFCIINIHIMSIIIPKQLYIGNVINVNRLQWLNQHNINTIICVASSKDVTISKEVRACKKVYQFDIMDNENQTLDFEPIIQLIEKSLEYGAVLVNCAVGMSRSPTFVIAYLMKTKKISLIQAYNIVKNARPKINQNRYFMEQLEIYQKELSD